MDSTSMLNTKINAQKSLSDALNQSCFCITLDRQSLCRSLEREAGDPEFCESYVKSRPHLFSSVPVFLPAKEIAAMQEIVAAIFSVSRIPTYRDRVLSWAPEIARLDHGPIGAFMGYDFHLDERGPRLIEINTNAGGAFLNALLAKAQLACCAEMEHSFDMPRAEDFNASVTAMFEAEMALQSPGRKLARIAIVDDQPESQYLYPEFLLARRVFLSSGIDAVIADPAQLEFSGGRLRASGKAIDLVYNRLVDFALEQPGHAALREAYERGAVVVTPNPHNHALLADKRNLVVLSDQAQLRSLGIPQDLRSRLSAVPRTVVVTKDNADELWQRRKALFFKPASGHGSKAVYRGDKVTRGVWNDVLGGNYVAQEFASPGTRMMKIDGQDAPRKMDVRLYAYGGKTMLVAARLYQGQATNFRTPGGGFAPVYGVGPIDPDHAQGTRPGLGSYLQSRGPDR